MEDKYTIIFTRLEYGQIIETVEKDKVREKCELWKKTEKLNKEKAYLRIEVVNNQTGEIREYWNNNDNSINF